MGGVGLSLSELQLPRPYLDPATYFATAASYAASRRGLARALGVYGEGEKEREREKERAQSLPSPSQERERDRLILSRISTAAGVGRRAMGAPVRYDLEQDFKLLRDRGAGSLGMDGAAVDNDRDDERFEYVTWLKRAPVASPGTCLSVYLSIFLSVCLSLARSLSIYPSIYLPYISPGFTSLCSFTTMRRYDTLRHATPRYAHTTPRSPISRGEEKHREALDHPSTVGRKERYGSLWTSAGSSAPGPSISISNNNNNNNNSGSYDYGNDDDDEKSPR